MNSTYGNLSVKGLLALKKMIVNFCSTSFIIFFMFIESVLAAEAEGVKNRACPDGWSQGGSIIPILYASTTIPWSNSSDQQAAMLEIDIDSVEKTVDVLPVTLEELVNDPLTVASQCLQYRNMVVDGTEYFPPSPDVERNVELAWIPAAIF